MEDVVYVYNLVKDDLDDQSTKGKHFDIIRSIMNNFDFEKVREKANKKFE